MSQEVSAEASGTVDTVFSPSDCFLPCVEDEGQGGFLSWLVPELPEAGWETGVCAGSRSQDVDEEAHPGACPQPGGAAALSPDTEAHLVQAPGPGQEQEPSPKVTSLLPGSAQGRTRSSRRLQNSLRVLAGGRPSTHCIVCRDLPQRARVVPKAVPPRPGEVEEGGRGAAGCSGRRPSFSKGRFPKRYPSHSPGPVPVRAQKERRRRECSGQGKEGAGGFSWLRGDTTPSGSLGGPRGPLSPGSTGLGLEELGGSWMEWILETAEVEGFTPGGHGAQTDSPCDTAGSLRSDGGEPRGEAAGGPSQSPVLCLDGPGKATVEHRESRHRIPAGAAEGCATSLAPGEQEEQAQAICRARPEQGLAFAPTLAYCPEPATSKAPSGPATGQRPSHSAETWRRSPELHAQDQGTSRNSDDPSTEKLEEMKMPCGVKQVCYMAAGPVIFLLGSLGQAKAEWPQPLQLEPLKDMMEVSTATPARRPRRKRRCKALHPTALQRHPQEAEETSAEQDRGEDAGQPSPEATVRDTVVRAMQKVLWSRLQELPDLALSREAVEGIAVDIEAALFGLTQATNGHYKNKYRSLLFNLQDPRNPELFLKVLRGSVPPHSLVRLSSIQLAPQDLARWRDQEEKRGLVLLEQLQKEPHHLPAFKVTHKGEVEILRDTDQTLTLEDLVGPVMPPMLEDPTEQHEPHALDPSSHIDTGLDPTCELQESLKAPGKVKDNNFQNILTPAPVCSPEMPQSELKPPVETQDRPQISAGPPKAAPSQPPWEGSVDMFSIKRFRAKAQLVSGHSCRLVMALPEVIRSAGCISSSTVWDLLASICPADAKDVCVVRLCPQGSRDVQNYRLLYSYLNNKQRHGLGAVEDMRLVLLPLPAFQPLPARFRPLGGPGLDVTHSSLLLAVLLPKAKLPDTAESNLLKGKVRKTVSFSKRVELRCYQPETRKPVVPPKGVPAPQQYQDRGSLTPRIPCTWQRPPIGRGRLWGEPEIRQRPEQGQRPPELHWVQSWHPRPAAPTDAGQSYGQHCSGASCPRQALLQYLESLVAMSQQLQASLGCPGQVHAPSSFATSAQPTTTLEILGLVCQLPTLPGPPGLASDSSLGPAEEAGPECPEERDPECP